MLAIAIPHKAEEPDGDEGGDTGDAHEIAGQLADLLGVPSDKQGDFTDLLHAYVKACASEDYHAEE